MAISFRSSTQAFGDQQPSVTVNRPAGAALGDVLVAIQFATGGTADMAAPAGWVQVGGVGVTDDIANGKVWYRVVDASDPEVYHFTLTEDASSVVFVAAYAGVDNANPIPELSWGGSSVFTTSHVAPSADPERPNTMLVCAWGATGAGDRSYSPPPAMTEYADAASGNVFGSAAYQLVTAAGHTSTRTAQCSEQTGYVSLSLSLRPALVVQGYEELIEWIDPFGGVTQLDAEWNLSGRFAPPPVFEEEGIPGQPGQRVRSVRHTSREMTIAIWLLSESEGALRRRLRDLVRKMNPTRGDGRIRVTTPAGDRRELVCRYTAGLEVDEVLGDSSGRNAQKAAVTFRAHDPYWLDVNDTVIEFTTGEVRNFFPFFPIHLTSSEVFTEGTVDNIGDVETWPVWEIHGPGEGIIISNSTTGRTIELPDVSLSDGESIAIDTRPGVKTILHSNGVNLFPELTPQSSLWTLAPGLNSVTIQMADSLETSKLVLTFRPRYLTV